MSILNQNDPQIARIIKDEQRRQDTTINLIASENYVSKGVLEATASVLTNKYAEGYPGKRYYSGCGYVDEAELLAIERCKQLFSAEHVNVQPHAGCQANMAVYFAALKPGDTIMGMSLAEGGHLTHGHAVNMSGTYFKTVQYAVDKETGLLNYDIIEELANQHKPKLIVAGASAYSRAIDFTRFAQIARQINAFFVADIAHIAGLVSAGLHQTPIGLADFVTSTTHKTLRGPRGGLIMCKEAHGAAVDRAIMPGTQGGPFMHIIAAKAVAFHEALQPEFKQYQRQIIANAQALAQAFINRGYNIVTGGTDNHLFIIDLRNKQINGKQAQEVLESVGITVSRSCIPFDPEKPWITSGIRLGTPALTTRGCTQQDMETVAEFIDEAIKHRSDAIKLATLHTEVKLFCSQFPIRA